MSRSNPVVNQNPCSRYFEWDGAKGNVRYYDKTEKENITVELPFTFLALDQLSKIGGWNQKQEASIYSNEVKNIQHEVLTVKVHGGGVLAQGYYQEIKDRVKGSGGHYLSSIYIAYKEGGLKIGNLSLKGAALSAWMDFAKKSGMDLWEKAVVIDGFEEGQNGNVTYRYPTFKLKSVSEESNQEAKDLDKTLQEYIKGRPTNVPDSEMPGDEPPPIDDNDLPMVGADGNGVYDEFNADEYAKANDDLPF